LIAPARTPKAVIERINGEVAKAMQLPDVTKRLIAEGSEAATSSPQAFSAHIRAEHEQWSRVIKQAGIRGQ
jgi:tripartite-type tricarboxylate transporter receptor subunit TctC